MVDTTAVSSSSVTVDSTLDEHATALQAYVDQQKAHLERLKVEVADAQSRISRGERAIAALSPPEVRPEKPEKQKGPGKRKVPGQAAAKKNGWVPSDRILTKVKAGLETHGEDYVNGVTINRLADQIGVAGETVKRSLEVLRERGEARFLGIREFPTKNPGRMIKAKAYKPMPTSFQSELSELSSTSDALVASLTEASDGGNG